MRARLGVVAAASLIFSGSAVLTRQAPTPGQSRSCSAESLAAIVVPDASITRVTDVPATTDVPAHCLVDGSVNTPGNSVNFRLRLPRSWNGKFFFHGVGGFAGSVEPAALSRTAPNNMLPALLRGYATASTDTGHQGTATDASWALNNAAKEIDYGYRGTHAATVAAKALTAAYYNAAPARSYFAGCSNGGGQALMEAQRYPNDFDGIIAGAPSFRDSIAARTLEYQTLLASKDSYIPASKLEPISKAALDACDVRDGLRDGLVSDPRACEVDLQLLLAGTAMGRTASRKVKSRH